jgi:hypothetical protein
MGTQLIDRLIALQGRAACLEGRDWTGSSDLARTPERRLESPCPAGARHQPHQRMAVFGQ